MISRRMLPGSKRASGFALLLLPAVGVPPPAAAAPIGFPPSAKPTYHFGVLAGMARSDVDEPAGGANSETYPLLTLLGTVQFGATRRVFGQLSFNSFTLDPGVDTVGQDVKQTGAAVSYQARFDAGGWRPWLGAGVGYARERFQNRLTVAPDGFIAQRFPDREENAFLLALSGTMQWRVADAWDVGVHLQYDYPMQGEVKTLSLSLSLLY